MGGNILQHLKGDLCLKRYQEFLNLKRLCPKNRIKITEDKLSQSYAWVEGIPHKGAYFNVIELVEGKNGNQTKFVWITDLKLTKKNITKIAKGGRLRWKIENEGFNIQKNRGFNLGHPYSQDEMAMKNYYLILQIAHILSQLVEKGNLLKASVKKAFGSVSNLFDQLLEDLRTKFIASNFSNKPMQIRLTSSFP